MFNDKNIDINSENIQGEFIENNTKSNESIKDKPPERDLRESQPTISVNYRVIKQNNTEINDTYKGYTDSKYQDYDDWEEIESNW